MSSKQVLYLGLALFIPLIGIKQTIFCLFIFITLIFGFLLHLIINKQFWQQTNTIYDRIRTSFVASKLISHINAIQFDSSRAKTSNEPAPLTGIPDIDQPLYQLVDLFIRDYVEIWYKTQISSDEAFIDDVKNGIYTTIRHLVERLKEIDWLDFCTGTIVDSYAIHVQLYRKAKERMRLEQSTDIRSCFFDLEAEYERGICRDEVCTDKTKEKEFLRDVVDVLLYILLPANEFRCVPARTIIREIAVNLAFIPFIDKYSDSDQINQLILTMCQQIPLTIDNFLLVVRTTDSRIELNSLIERLDIETNRWRSKDTGGENDADIRATLNSYQYLKKLLLERLEIRTRLASTIFDDDDLPSKVSFRELPLTEILNNGNGLEYFLKFLQSVDAGGYGNFYLNAEAFRCAGLSASQQNANSTPEHHKANQDILRSMANDLIEQYFLPTGSLKLPMDENLINKTLKVMNTQTIDETLLDELQAKILSANKYYGHFKTTPQYLKVLSEIDFTDSLNDNNSDAASLSSNNSNELSTDSQEPQQQSSPGVSTGSTTALSPDMLDNIENYLITTEINESGVCCEKGEKYAIYVISVSCKPLHSNTDEQRREWITYRRYSEFNDLHMTIRKRYPTLKEFIHLPSKSFMNSTSEEVRVKRQKELNDYLATVTKPKVLQNNPGLGELLLKFLRNQQWKHEQTELARKDFLASAVDTLVNPFKQASLGIVKGVSKIGGGINIVSDSVMDNVGKIFRTNGNQQHRMNIKLNKETNTFSIVEDNQAENAKNIPLRVLLVIMDEVFDLKQKNMWFRSRFVSILKRFLRAFMGDSVNRRIAMFVQHWTSASKIAKEITRFKDDFWPNGILADKPAERDLSVRHITQVLCKAKLLGIVSDELRHIIGSETTRRGLLRLFELLQNETLNRRFVYIVLEALLIKLFRPNELHFIFERLYSQSARVKEEYRRRIFEQEHYHTSVLIHQQHYSDPNQRPYYLNRLTVRTDDYQQAAKSNSFQTQKLLPRSFSKMSK